MPSRFTNKSRLDRLCDRVKNLASTEDPSLFRTILDNIRTEFELYRDNYENDLDDPEDEKFQEEFFQLDDKVLEATSKLTQLIEQSTADTSSNKTQNSSLSDVLNRQQQLLEAINSNSRKSTTTALPKITMPHFSGKPHEWVAFRDMFMSTIHRNPDLSDIQKLQHLRNSVSGDAESLIKTIPLTENNYEVAWQSMVDAFNDEYQIIESIFKRFLSTTSKVSPESQINLRTKFNTFRETFDMLRNEGEYATTLDPLAIYLMSKSLDSETAFEWAKFTKRNKQPKIDEFLEFLGEHCKLLERSKLTQNLPFSNKSSKTSTPNTVSRGIRSNATAVFSCMHCAGEHSIYKCQSFLSLSISERKSILSKQARCFNCFSKDHQISNCKSAHRCHLCHQKHNTLIHTESKSGSPSPPIEPSSPKESPSVKLINSSLSERLGSNLSSESRQSNILPTVQIRVRAIDGTYHVLRGLLDSGSQATLISEKSVKKLGLKRKFSRVPISSIANTGSSVTRGRVEFEFTAANLNSKTFSASAHITSLNGVIPQSQIQVSCLAEINSKMILADPQFYLPSNIDLIFSASFFAVLLKPSKFHCATDKLYFLETHLGFVACSGNDVDSSLSVNSVDFDAPCLDRLLEKFWSIENVSSDSLPETTSDQECEKIFRSSTSRLPSGRFCVRLPFRHKVSLLGSTKWIALRRFASLEKRFSDDRELRADYQEFMSDYESLGHMTKSNYTLDSLPLNHYIIPHHGVYQQGPCNRKLRVVFDASAKSSSGYSLNDILHTGSRLQNDITSVLNKFRQYEYVLTADIVKMYRQINVHKADRDFQLILWRSCPKDPIELYSMNTVTYGESCSPYLALRVLQELVNQEGNRFPSASKILISNRYVDDVLFGHNDINQLELIRSELVELLNLGCFELKKWTSNRHSLVETFRTDELANPHIFTDDQTQTIKTLGIVWIPSNDQFTFNYTLLSLPNHTKRTLLSEAARFFDPLGLISPVVVNFKALFQETWTHKLDWDETLPDILLQKWLRIRDEIPLLDQVKVNRHFGTGELELHGFADASQSAYAAVVYTRIVNLDGTTSVQLVMSKTKLAPIKQLSIPRLELCAAHLLAKLMSKVRSDLEFEGSTHLWSDSTTVLCWIKSLPREWNSFVANRVGMIHELCPSVPWHYVKSAENPADLASRGCSPSQLLRSDLWWTGPVFLSQSSFQIPASISFETTEEKRPLKVHSLQIDQGSILDSLNRFSNFNRLIRSFAYVHRFLGTSSDLINPRLPGLSASELERSLTSLIKLIQKQSFHSEIIQLTEQRPLSKTSVIQNLNPLIDERGLLRVRGRLYLHPQTTTAPILLPNCHFSELLALKIHKETFHGGIQLMCSRILERYWMISLNRIVKRVYQSCTTCKRYRGQTFNPPMGQLPATRISSSKPFLITGLDFAGPISLRPTLRRGRGTEKGYFAVFVCFCTKAVHLELVMGLSTNCLISAIHRFIARRGTVEKIVSDNGRNFVGVNRACQDFRAQIKSSTESEELANFLSKQLISWEFIPPYSPHFGGLWESGVKSVKGHLARSFHGTIMTIEEIQTALCQIENILNSRPLVPISFFDQLSPITPAHLLTGHPPACLPSSLIASNSSSSNRHRMEVLSNTVRSFWRRWRSEYLPRLMKRSKWLRSSTPAPTIGDVVLIRRPADPPHFWPIARITKIFPGKDNTVRVVEVSTAETRRRESVRNLVPLLVESNASTPGSMSAERSEKER